MGLNDSLVKAALRLIKASADDPLAGVSVTGHGGPIMTEDGRPLVDVLNEGMHEIHQNLPPDVRARVPPPPEPHPSVSQVNNVFQETGKDLASAPAAVNRAAEEAAPNLARRVWAHPAGRYGLIGAGLLAGGYGLHRLHRAMRRRDDRSKTACDRLRETLDSVKRAGFTSLPLPVRW